MTILTISKLHKRFAGVTATDHLDLEIREGEIHAIIGPNGAGKTTLINQISGSITPDSGSIVFDSRDITYLSADRRARYGIGRSYQIASVFNEMTALENTILAVQGVAGHSFSFWRSVLSDRRLVEPAREALKRVGIEHHSETPVSALAHGVRRQLEIAMTIAMQPKLLLLDEPMAGMSHYETAEIMELLRSIKGQFSILLVEHDMDVVFSLADRITVLVYGRPLVCGSPDQIKLSAEVKTAYLGDQEYGV